MAFRVIEAVDTAERFIYQSSRSKLLLVLLSVMLVKSGIWQIPNLGASVWIAHEPRANPFADPDAHYLYWSWLGSFVAWFVHARDIPRYFLLHLAFAVLATALHVRNTFRWLPEEQARTSCLIFVLLPVSATAYYWVSMDGLTLLLFAIALAFPHRWPVTWVAGVALGMQHFEQSFIAAVAVLCMVLLGRDTTSDVYRAGWAGALAIGVITGKILLYLLFVSFDAQVNSGRLYWFVVHWPRLIEQFLLNLPIILWSLLALAWVLAAHELRDARRSWPFWLSFAGLLALVPLTDDETRVFAITSYPLLAVRWLHAPGFLESINRRCIAKLALMWLIVPWIWVWQGEPGTSAFPYDVAWLLNRLFGWFNVPENAAGWPWE